MTLESQPPRRWTRRLGHNGHADESVVTASLEVPPQCISSSVILCLQSGVYYLPSFSSYYESTEHTR